MNLLEQQISNRRRTWAVMLVFVAFLFFLGVGFDLIFVGGGVMPVPIGSMLALGLGGVSAWSSYYAGDRAVLLSSHAIPIDQAALPAPEDAKLKYRQLEDVVEEMSIAAGLPPPKIYIVPDRDPNAFATGRDPQHASIAVTQGLLDTLNRDELQGVVAHELSHVRNLDIRLMTVIAAMVGAAALLSDWTSRGLLFGGGGSSRSRNREQGGGLFGLVLLVIWVIAVLLAPIIGQALAMMVSRRREYLADASGAELTRNPMALASALAKIDEAVDPTVSIKQGTANLCIADPLGRQIGLREGKWANLFASHPPMAQRIAALRQMAFQQ
ncbi:MAG TPA: M48 family metallopeptidase [Vicinamibacterales bacterium]|nr:M48 family metallopeptidase [Vicinamibacterales bacterium]